MATNEPVGSTKVAPGNWGVWQSRFRWFERCSVYDAESQLIRSQQIEEERRQDHLERLERYRYSQEQLGSSQSSIAAQLIIKIDERLKDLKPEEIDVKTLPAYLKAAADLCDRAGTAWGRSLGMEDLLALLTSQSKEDCED